MSIMKLMKKKATSSSQQQQAAAAGEARPADRAQQQQQRSSAASLRRRSSQASQQTSSRRRSSAGSRQSMERRRSSLISMVGRKAPLSVDFLVAKRRWAELADLLKTERGREDVVANFELEVDCLRAAETTYLHAACRHGAPLDVVRALYEVVPDAVSVRDCDGRTPLHCACAGSACPITEVNTEVVSFLLELDSKSQGGHAVATRDDRGRLPVHLAAGAVRECDDEESGDEYLFFDSDALSPPDSDIIRQLIAIHPYSANIEDGDGCTSLEYAILSGVDVKTVRRMRKTSEAVWKKEQENEATRRLAEMKTMKAKAKHVEIQAEAHHQSQSQGRRPSLVQMDSTRKVKRGATAA